MQNFLRGRINLVRVLIADVPAASYADLVLIICAVLSACSSRRWPGQGIDKRRFIELLVMHSPPDFRTSWVSVPALIKKVSLAKMRPHGECREILIVSTAMMRLTLASRMPRKTTLTSHPTIFGSTAMLL